MKSKNLGLGLAIVAGILVWQGILMTKTTSKPLTSQSEVVTGETQRPAGEVSVEVNYLAGKSDENQIVFEVPLNTHSVDLDDINFQKSVVLEKSGQKFFPLEVKTSGSDHHRSTVLSFPRVGVPLKIVFLGTPEVGRQEFEFGELK